MQATAALTVVATWIALATAAPGQVVAKEIGLRNTTGTGSTTIQSTVWLPAGAVERSIGPNASYPVVVFLHGNFQIGRNYSDIGRGLAERGYVCVMPNTHATDPLQFRHDAFAMFAVLRAENARTDSPLVGRLDMERVGLCGHSWGGAHTIGVLAKNPGYRVGTVLAPHMILPQDRPEDVRVPLTMVAHAYDARTPPKYHVDPTYSRLTGAHPFRARYVLRRRGGGFNHLNVAMRGTLAADVFCFDRSFAIVCAMMDRFLKQDPRALDALFGANARTGGELSCSFATPQYFKTGEEKLGRTAALHVAAERGIVIHLAALGRIQHHTPWGVLRLDPATAMVAKLDVLGSSGLSTLEVPVPDLEGLRDLELHYQALATNAAGRTRLSDPLTLTLR